MSTTGASSSDINASGLGLWNLWVSFLAFVVACLLGVFSFAAWYYALHRGKLVTGELSAEEAESITRRIKAEPVTAAITIPFAMGMWMWELSWFIYPFVVYIYNRKFKSGS